MESSINRVSPDFYNREYFLNDCEGVPGILSDRQSKICSFVPADSGKILDIGCGRGEISNHLNTVWRTVIGVDYSIYAREICLEKFGNEFIYLCCDINDILPAINHNIFDCIILADVIEHLYDKQIDMMGVECSRILKPGGLVVIDTPIMGGTEWKNARHVNIKPDVNEVVKFFPDMFLKTWEWFKEPEHCNIILCKQ